MGTTSLSPDSWERGGHTAALAGPLVCSASGFASEKHGVSASSAVVPLWAHPWAQASLLQRAAAAHPRPRPVPVLPPSAAGWGAAFCRPALSADLPCRRCQAAPAWNTCPWLGLQRIPSVCFLPPHAHSASLIRLCPEDGSLTRPLPGTPPAARSAPVPCK